MIWRRQFFSLISYFRVNLFSKVLQRYSRIIFTSSFLICVIIFVIFFAHKATNLLFYLRRYIIKTTNHRKCQQKYCLDHITPRKSPSQHYYVLSSPSVQHAGGNQFLIHILFALCFFYLWINFNVKMTVTAYAAKETARYWCPEMSWKWKVTGKNASLCDMFSNRTTCKLILLRLKIRF